MNVQPRSLLLGLGSQHFLVVGRHAVNTENANTSKDHSRNSTNQEFSSRNEINERKQSKHIYIQLYLD